MPRKAATKKWSKEELNKIKNYSLLNQEDLVYNLYTNIVIGYMRFRKPRRFFVNLGQILKRSSSICKSKFQKLEKEIYTGTLRIPNHHYEVFCWIRNLTKERVNYKFNEIKEKIKDEITSQKSKSDSYNYPLIFRKEQIEN